MQNQYESISIQFRDVSDGVNRRQRTRTFTTRLFTKGDHKDELDALDELCRSAKKRGFTTKEMLKVRRRQVDFVTDFSGRPKEDSGRLNPSRDAG